MNMRISKAWRQLSIIAGLLIFLQITGSLQFLEEKLYENMMFFSNKKAHHAIEIVAIDDESVKRLGGWQLSRAVYAQILTALKDAKVVVFTTFLDKIQYPEFNKILRDMLQFYEASHLVNESTKFSDDIRTLSEKIYQLNQLVNTDQLFADAIRQHGNVILSMPLWLNNHTDTSVLLAPSQLPVGFLSDWIFKDFPPSASVALPPLAQLSSGALRIGATAFGIFNPAAHPHIEPLLFRYREQIYPSLILQIAKTLIPRLEILQNGLQWGDYFISTDTQWQMRPFLYPPKPNQTSAFATTPLYQLYENKVASGLFRDKIVLIGLTASSRLVPTVETASAPIPPVISLANSLASLLNRDVISFPQWKTFLQHSIFLISFIILLLDFLQKRWLMMIALSGLVILLSAEFVLLVHFKMWLNLLLPILLISTFLGFELLKKNLPKLWRFLQQDAEANRLLGLLYQGQGRLELAYEKFTQCPIDENLFASLYNLALDFERKFQLQEALKTYHFIYEHDPDYRDCVQAMQRLQIRLNNTNGNRPHHLSNWLEEYTENRKPIIGGRFQIEKKIASGAMGVVYLGRELKLDRMVAIKTLTLSKEFDGLNLQEVLERFFREASAAGRLTHEHIISIYDAGEDDDIAYLAMEYFKGGNLVPYTRKENLLSVDEFLSVAIKISEALHYAHSQGVIHRDIKPANILYNYGNKNLKITDFGIARITDHKQTKTGTPPLGSPSYMSPEQVSGKIVDGRSDLFSLGVTFYQLLSGTLPFNSDSIPSLMYKIATEQPRDLLKLRPDLPRDLCDMIGTLLEKKPEQRYSEGARLAQALRDCQATWALKTEEHPP
ncbi:MAG: hypothetical protein RIT27_1269 [Pseudomonadota bacterium]|jgi:serine/threonine-protein kinase